MRKSLRYVLFGSAVLGGFGLINALNPPNQPTSGIVVNSAMVVFPLSRPGDTIQILKVMDCKGAIVLQSNSPFVKTPYDLVKLERQEYDAKRQKYGAMSDGLIGKIINFTETDSFIVKVSLKNQTQTNGQAPDKTKYSKEFLLEWAKKDLQRTPFIDKAAFIQKFGIAEMTVSDNKIDKIFKNSNNMMIVNTNKKMLVELCFDENVASVEEYQEPRPCVTTCGVCTLKTIQYSTPPCFSTLATSAYNPASAMPSNSLGQNVNVATYEHGLRQHFVNCIALGNNLKSWVKTNDGPGTDASHSEQCFRCLINAAPQANFYHFAAFYPDDNNLEDSIQTYSIQTISNSTGLDMDPTDESMIHVDRWAYRSPYPVWSTGTGNEGYCQVPFWRSYNAINVGNCQHYNQQYYKLIDTALDMSQSPENCSLCNSPPYYCNGHCNNWGCTQAANPPPRYGSRFQYTLFDCSACNSGSRGDRELPMLVAPGISPVRYDINNNPVTYPHCGISRMSDPCIYSDADYPSNYPSCEAEGTSYSAPIANGIAACVISADQRMEIWPEKVRVALLLTAQNVDFHYWSYQEDGRDGAGVISGANAVFFAQHHDEVNPGDPADTVGLCAASLSNSNQQQNLNFNIKIPNTIPSGKHLRIVLTWDGSPSIDDSQCFNDLSDLDLIFQANSKNYYSLSWDSNVEMVDVDNSQLTAGNSYTATVEPITMRIGASGTPYSNIIWYAIGWTWVQDHAL